jgi:hypothetical protein
MFRSCDENASGRGAVHSERYQDSLHLRVTFTAYSRANAMVAVNYSIWRMRIGSLSLPEAVVSLLVVAVALALGVAASAPALRERSLRPQSI